MNTFNMKRIALIGASGFIGSVILKEALERGHLVTAIVRNPQKINLNHSNLIIKECDVLVPENVEIHTKGNDVVISAYNPGWTNTNIAEDTTKAYRSIIEGIKKAEIPRLLIVGGAGSLLVPGGKRLMDTGVIPKSYLPAVEALANVYYGLKENESDLNWSFFSPAGNITPGIRTCEFRLGKDYMIVGENGESNISVQDYAVAMINEVENPQHINQRFTIGY